MLFRALRTAAMLAAIAAPPAAEPWTGRIEIVETVGGVERKGDQTEQDAVAKAMQERVNRLRERLKTATPTVARTLRTDLAHLEGDLERLAIERGSTAQTGRTLYAIGPARTLADGDEAKVVIDRAAGVATLSAAGRDESVRVPPPPAPRALDDAKPGPAAFGAPTRRGKLVVDDRVYVVTLAEGLPNPYALSLLPATAKDPLYAALASLPGLPVEVELKRNDVVRRWTVKTCEPGPVDESGW
jgi:hypothetical protein